MPLMLRTPHAAVLLLSAAAVASTAVPQQGSSCRVAAGPSEHALLQHGSSLHNPKREVPVPTDKVEDYCHTTVEGERCFARVSWVMRYDLSRHPERYEGLSQGATAEEVQDHLHRAGVHFCPAPCGVPSVPARDGGDSEPACNSQIIEMDFFNARVEINEEYQIWEQPLPIRYHGLGQVNGRSFDLVVSTPDLGVTGGMGNGGSKFGSVVVRPGVAAEMHFRFVDSLTGSPVELRSFLFSFFDLDGSPSDGWRPTMERLHIGGFDDYSLYEDSEVVVSEGPDGRTTFEGSQIGFGCDNPIDPLSLGYVICFWPPGHAVDQRKRAVTFRFSRKSGFNVTLVSDLGGGWRSFMFAGSSSLMTACSLQLPDPTPAPTPMPAPTPLPIQQKLGRLGEEGRLGLCAVFGDPHFITFDGGHTVAFGERTLWLVRSEAVWIQAWSRGSQGRLGALAVSGAFLWGHTVVLYKDAQSELEVLYDGEPILPKGNSTFTAAGIVEGVRSDVWRTDLHDGDILEMRTELQFDLGPWPERFLGKPKGGVVLLRLPQGVEITATGVNFMSTVITMPAQEGGQGGYCGNFNGDVEDDAEPLGPSFNVPMGPGLEPVPEAQDLLRESGVVGKVGALDDGQTAAAVAKDPREVMAQCGAELKERASSRCGHVPNMRLRADCVLDVCATGDLAVAEDVLAAEVLEEKVNARGIPVLVGLGQCLDADGERYSGYVAAAATVQQCTDTLRSFALTQGVVGAEFGSGSMCHVLVDTDKAQQRLLGDAVAVAGSGGRGLVSAASGVQDWKCWQLA